MSRAVSAAFRAAAYAQETGEVFLVLLEIDHEDMAGPIRVVNNRISVVSNGNVYLGYGFLVEFPTDTEGEIQSARLTIDNVDRQIVQAIRSVSSSPTVTMKVVLASSPDTIEWGPVSFEARNVNYNVESVSADLVYHSLMQQALPAIVFDPINFPGMF